MSEKIADIVAQMRGRGEDGRMDMSLWRQYADRIEEAAKREKAETEAEAHAVGGVVEAARQKHVGNAAAMREALVAVKKSLDGIGKSSLDCDPTILMASLTQVCARLSARIERVLAAPPRNCDKGTPQEQEARWNDYCDDVTRGDCPPSAGCKSCALYWAQMPTRRRKKKPMAYKVHLDTCPFCGMEDTAQLIPHGIGIAKFFIVRCVVKRGGCGASVTGKTRRMAEKAWNRNPPDTQEEGVAK